MTSQQRRRSASLSASSPTHPIRTAAVVAGEALTVGAVVAGVLSGVLYAVAHLFKEFDCEEAL